MMAGRYYMIVQSLKVPVCVVRLLDYVGSDLLRKKMCDTSYRAVRTNMMDRPKAAAEDLLHPAEPRPIHDGEGQAGSGHF